MKKEDFLKALYSFVYSWQKNYLKITAIFSLNLRYGTY